MNESTHTNESDNDIAALGQEDERLQREIWERQCPVLLARCDGLEDIARAAITWAPGDAKIALAQRLEDVLNGR